MAIPFLNNLNLNNNEVQNVKLHNTGSAPNNAEGQIYFNTSDKLAKYYSNGTDLWVSLKEYSFTDGTYIDVTTTGTTVKPIFELDLSAVDGAAGSSERYLTKSNKWALVSEIVGTTYDLSGFGTTNGTAGIQLVGSDATTDQIDITGSGTTTVTHSANTITITSNDQYTGTVTSVGLSMPSAFTVANSPVTVADTLTVTGAGTTAQYIDGTGALQTFPAIDNTTYSFDLSAVSSNSTTLTLDASSGDDDTVTFEGTTNEIEITTPATGDAGTVKIGLPDNVIIGDKLTVQGNLVVNGDTTTVSTTNLNVEDALIGLQNELAGSNSNDIGLIMERGTSGDNAAFIWDESEGKFTLGTTTDTAASTGAITVTAGTLVAALEGNATTATTLANSRNFSITGDITASAVSFNGSGNVELNANIDANVVGATELNVSGNGTSGQVLASDGDGTFSWVAQTTDTNTQLATAAALIDVSAMGSNTTASFTHSLASKNLIVQMYDVTTGEVVFADIDHTSNNAISVIFASTPPNDIRVVVIDAKNGLTDKTVSYS
jgi:hypothetical protein